MAQYGKSFFISVQAIQAATGKPVVGDLPNVTLFLNRDGRDLGFANGVVEKANGVIGVTLTDSEASGTDFILTASSATPGVAFIRGEISTDGQAEADEAGGAAGSPASVGGTVGIISGIGPASSLAEVQAAYDANASYMEDNSVAKCRAFITACRILIRRTPVQHGTRESHTQTSVQYLEQELTVARQWLAANAPSGSAGATAGVSRFDFTNSRS